MTDAAFDSLVGGQQRLGDNLAAEDAEALFRRRETAKQVHLDLVEGERLDEFVHRGELGRHGLAYGGAQGRTSAEAPPS